MSTDQRSVPMSLLTRTPPSEDPSYCVLLGDPVAHSQQFTGPLCDYFLTYPWLLSVFECICLAQKLRGILGRPCSPADWPRSFGTTSIPALMLATPLQWICFFLSETMNLIFLSQISVSNGTVPLSHLECCQPTSLPSDLCVLGQAPSLSLT